MKAKAYSIIAALGAGTQNDKLPDWYLMFPEGEAEVEGDGKYLVDRDAWLVVQAKLLRRGIEIVVDYEHQTVNGSKAPAAGWAREWRWGEGVGIEAKIDWTEEAAEYIAKGEYRYYSPVFLVRETDKRLAGIHSIALTNAPRTNHLKPLLAKLGAQHQTEGEQKMGFLKQVIAKLGLDENSTEEQVLQALAGMANKKVEAKVVIPAEVTQALGVKEGDDVSTIVASINVLKQQPKTMVAKSDFDDLKATLAKRDADEAVAGALADGKITPDQKSWAAKYAERDLDGFKTFVAKAPVVVPVGELPGASAKENNMASIDDATLTVAKMMDVEEADLKKYGGLQ